VSSPIRNRHSFLRFRPIASQLTVIKSTAILAASLLSISAHAADPDWWPKPPPRVSEDVLRAEILVLDAGFDTRLRIDNSAVLQGSEIAAEDDLGLQASQVLVQGELTLLPGDHHLVRLSGLSSHRTASRFIDKEIVFDDQTYLVGERVDSELNLTMVGLTYGYRFLVRDRAELTGTFGIQVAQVQANALVRSRVLRDAESGVAPLPLAGLEGRFDMSKRWSFEGRLQYLKVNIRDVDGSILDWRLGLTWRSNPHWLFGLGYRQFDVKVDSKNESNPGFVDLNIGGPMLFMRASL
jgi:hypothetical protein